MITAARHAAIVRPVILAAALVALGAVVAPLAGHLRAAARFSPDALRRDEPVAALFGGLRALAADVVWLEAYSRWEDRDPAATTALLTLATSIDSRPLTFWLNGARILAYDVPAWRADAAGASESVRRAIAEEQARRALAWLDRAETAHPAHPALAIERAAIELNVLGDPAAAAADYRRAAERPGAPYFAARLHAELLRRLGRKAEALAWLRQLHPTLPADDPAAEADVVLGRIRELEADLQVPPSERYVWQR